MNKLITVAVLIIVALFTFCPVGMAAKAKPKPKPKPVQKPPVTAPHIVLGTTQYNGENGQLNTVYTLGKDEPFNITLKSAEYTVEPILIGDKLYTVTNQEKFLLLHMTYQNPLPSERFIRWDSFGFTAVDAQDQNHDGLIDLGAENDRTIVNMTLKPAQKKEVYGAIIVPAAGEIPKLMIKSSDELVIRYNLIGKVKGLPELYADTADKSGATALSKVKAKADVYYPVGVFSFKLNKVELSTAAKIGETELPENSKFCIVNFNLKNNDKGNQFFRWDTLIRKIIDTDGADTGECNDVLLASKEKSYQADMEPAQELTLRYVFTIPADTTMKSFTIAIEQGRTLEFDITNVK